MHPYPLPVNGSDAKVEDAVWFTAGSATVGVVRVATPFENKYYIGCGKGYDEAFDATYIAMHGAPFPVPAGAVLFPTRR